MKAADNETRTVESRRRFLKTVAVAGGVAAVAGSGTAVAMRRDVEEPKRKAGKHGYSETKHVRDYYAKAAF